MGDVIDFRAAREIERANFIDQAIADVTVYAQYLDELLSRATVGLEDLITQLQESHDDVDKLHEVLIDLTKHGSLTVELRKSTCIRIISLDPRNAEAYAHLGMIYKDNLDLPERAERCYLRALAFADDEQKPGILFSLSGIYQTTSKLEEAEQCLIKRTEISGKPYIKAQLAAFYSQTKRYDRAIRWREEARRIWDEEYTPEYMSEEEFDSQREFYTLNCLALSECYDLQDERIKAKAVLVEMKKSPLYTEQGEKVHQLLKGL